MRCAEVEQRLHEALDKRLEPTADPALAEHLRSCAGCRTSSAALASTTRWAAGLAIPRAPADLSDRVIDRLLDGPLQLSERPAQYPRAMHLALAAAVLGVLAIPAAYWLGAQRREQADAGPTGVAPMAAVGDRAPAIRASRQTDTVDQALRASAELAASLFELRSFSMDSKSTGAARQPSWGEEFREGIAPVTHSTAAALDVLWNAIPLAAEDKHS